LFALLNAELFLRLARGKPQPNQSKGLEPIHWVDSSFHPYYLTEKDLTGEQVKKLDLFSQRERMLYKAREMSHNNQIEQEGCCSAGISQVYHERLHTPVVGGGVLFF
jgi:hypothetical protein